MVKILLENISNVKELKEALNTIPDDAEIYPFGSGDCKLAYDDEENTAYIDEDLNFLDFGDLD